MLVIFFDLWYFRKWSHAAAKFEEVYMISVKLSRTRQGAGKAITANGPWKSSWKNMTNWAWTRGKPSLSAAVFRLADMLDTNYQRAPEIVSSIKYPNGEIPSKWRGRQAITGWYLDEKDRIILQIISLPGI
jgi:hypothetical protein